MSAHREYEIRTTINTDTEATVVDTNNLEYYLVVKRYSDFEALYNKLVTNYLEYLVPPLPDKSLQNFFANEESEFVT